MEEKITKSPNQFKELLESIATIEDKKTLALKSLSIREFKNLCQHQEKLIVDLLNKKKSLRKTDFDSAKVEKINEQSYVNKKILISFKNLADIYFEPFYNKNYKKDGTNKKLPLRSFSIST